jgi:hypothetical protein
VFELGVDDCVELARLVAAGVADGLLSPRWRSGRSAGRQREAGGSDPCSDPPGPHALRVSASLKPYV